MNIRTMATTDFRQLSKCLTLACLKNSHVCSCLSLEPPNGLSILTTKDTAGGASLVVSAQCSVRSPTLPELSPCRVYPVIKGIISRSEACGTQCKCLERLTTKERKSSHSLSTSHSARISQNVSPYQKCILPDLSPPRRRPRALMAAPRQMVTTCPALLTFCLTYISSLQL